MRFFCGIAVATAGMVALRARHALGAKDMLDDVLDDRQKAAEELVEMSQEMGATGQGQFDPAAVEVAELQGMAESDLKLELRALYSISKDAREKLLFPVGSLDAMQEMLNHLNPVDEDARDVHQFMSRYAYLIAKCIKKYDAFYGVKIKLSEPQTAGQEYVQVVKKFPEAAAEWTKANDLLVSFLTLAGNDLRDKWEQRATTERRLRDFLEFVRRLGDVYEAQQRGFRTGYAIAKLRYMEHPDKQADLSLLMNDPRQKAAQVEFDDALEVFQEKTHLARKAAKSPVEAGILPEEFLTLLPFPPDRQREQDDLPDDEF